MYNCSSVFSYTYTVLQNTPFIVKLNIYKNGLQMSILTRHGDACPLLPIAIVVGGYIQCADVLNLMYLISAYRFDLAI